MKNPLGNFLTSCTIVLGCIVAAIVYGILHDQVTARVCVEYFSVFHPRVIASESPTMLALVWGVIATWWVGALLGVPLAVAARSGSRPKRSIRSLVRPVATLMVVMGGLALVAGITGYALGRAGAWSPPGWVAEQLPKTKHPRFLADLAAHNASYASGFVGGLVVIVRVWQGRSRNDQP